MDRWRTPPAAVDELDRRREPVPGLEEFGEVRVDVWCRTGLDVLDELGVPPAGEPVIELEPAAAGVLEPC